MVKATWEDFLIQDTMAGPEDLRGLEGVVGGEVDGEEEHTALVGAVGWAHYGRLQVQVQV